MYGTILINALPVFRKIINLKSYIGNASYLCRHSNEIASIPDKKLKIYIDEYTQSQNYKMIKLLTAKHKAVYKFTLIKCWFLKIKLKIIDKYYMIKN